MTHTPHVTHLKPQALNWDVKQALEMNPTALGPSIKPNLNHIPNKNINTCTAWQGGVATTHHSERGLLLACLWTFRHRSKYGSAVTWGFVF